MSRKKDKKQNKTHNNTSSPVSHDKLFKQIEQVKENAIDFIRGTFPADIVAELNLDSLTQDSASYVDERFSEHFSDLIYNCKLKNRPKQEVKITLLFEHKSYPPKHIHFQLLRYMLNIWEKQDKNKIPLTLVIPAVFYHGQKEWEIQPMKTYFGSEGENSVFSKFIPDFDYILSDLHHYTDEDIQDKFFERDINKALMMLFKYVFDAKGLKDHLKHIFVLLKKRFGDEKSKSAMLALLTYLYYNLEEMDSTEFFDKVATISVEAKEVSMTLAAQLIDRGKQEGIQEGLQEGLQKGIQKGIQKGKQEGLQEGSYKAKLETARNMLHLGAEIDFIVKATGLSANEVEKLKNEIQ